ncbi:precorrin-2 dehydrogenase/sirohydrochlorin ferrochelatase family protein [Phosphitispora sp. TUW77]|uniref:precorrin-2 dehydrogenase/sirohydrochlorin ferrochelatase family protein n=1 Tax=Phosphitispora sp. TUW77 TaxID=3152361 RepID=UPI003AB73434
MFNYYPVYLNLDGKKCLVVGGGKVAERKIRSILEAGARAYVVSPELTDWLEEAALKGKITAIRRNYTTTDLENAFIVISATDSQVINSRVASECRDRNILVNVVDCPADCNFIVPAVFRQGALSISISTDGKSPMLARRIKEDMETKFGPEYHEFLELMSNLREQIIKKFSDEEQRRDMFKKLVYSDIIQLLKDGQREKVKERISYVLGNDWTQS